MFVRILVVNNYRSFIQIMNNNILFTIGKSNVLIINYIASFIEFDVIYTCLCRKESTSIATSRETSLRFELACTFYTGNLYIVYQDGINSICSIGTENRYKIVQLELSSGNRSCVILELMFVT